MLLEQCGCISVGGKSVWWNDEKVSEKKKFYKMHLQSINNDEDSHI